MSERQKEAFRRDIENYSNAFLMSYKGLLMKILPLLYVTVVKQNNSNGLCLYNYYLCTLTGILNRSLI